MQEQQQDESFAETFGVGSPFSNGHCTLVRTTLPVDVLSHERGCEDAGSTDEISGAPIDFDRVNVVAERFATDDRFSEIDVQPEFAPDRIVCRYDSGFYPRRVQSARLEMVWFENGDFSLHYHEAHEEGAFDHR